MDYSIDSIDISMTLSDGTVLALDETNIILGSLKLKDSSSSATDFRFGSVISRELDFELDNYDESYNSYDFVGAVINLRMGYSGGSAYVSDTDGTVDLGDLTNAVTLTDGIITDDGATIDTDYYVTFSESFTNDASVLSVLGGTVEVPCGVYYVTDKPTYNSGTIAFTALDALWETAKPYETALTYPTTLQAVYDEICESCGLTSTGAVLPFADYTVQAAPTSDSLTYADILGCVAEICGGFAHTNDDGEVLIRQYGGVVNGIGSSYTSEVDTEEIAITGVAVVECFDEIDGVEPESYVSGEYGYLLHVEENPLIQSGDAQTVADYLAGIYVNFTFRPMRLTVPKDPTIHAGNKIIYTDRNGNVFTAYATDITFGTDDATVVQMGAKSPAENESTQYSGASRALNEARRLTSSTAIFDKIYATGINADYITTGTLTSRAIDNGGGTFTVDEDGNMTATSAEITGTITAESGTLGGWTIDSDGITQDVTESSSTYTVSIDSPTSFSTPFISCETDGTNTLSIYPEGQAVFGSTSSTNGEISLDPQLGLSITKTGYGTVSATVGDESYELEVADSTGYIETYISDSQVMSRDYSSSTTTYSRFTSDGALYLKDSSSYGALTATKLATLLNYGVTTTTPSSAHTINTSSVVTYTFAGMSITQVDAMVTLTSAVSAGGVLLYNLPKLKYPTYYMPLHGTLVLGTAVLLRFGNQSSYGDVQASQTISSGQQVRFHLVYFSA